MIFADFVGVLTYINSWKVKFAVRILNIFTVTKVLALALITGIGVYYLLSGKFFCIVPWPTGIF